MTAVAGAAVVTGCPLLSGCGLLPSLGGSIASDAASSVFSAMTSWLASGAVGLVDHVLALVSSPTGATTVTTAAQLPGHGVTASATSPSLGASWFTGQEGLMVELMGLLVLPLLMISTIGAVLRQDLGRLARTWLMALPLALVCGIAGVELTRTGLDLTDALSSAVLSGVDVGSLGRAVGEITASTGANGPITIVVIAGLAILAAILLWLELVLRAAAVYVALLFLPLAMSGLVWPATSRMAKRLVELLVALVLSKFVVASVLSLGVHAVVQGGDDGALQGAAMLLLAAFAPFVLFRMVPIIEAEAIAHLEGVSRRPFQAATRVAQGAASFAGGPLGVAIGLSRRSSEPDVGPVPVSAQPITEHPGEYAPESGGGSGQSSSSVAVPVGRPGTGGPGAGGPGTGGPDAGGPGGQPDDGGPVGAPRTGGGPRRGGGGPGLSLPPGPEAGNEETAR